MFICIDPGHGGRDLGAWGKGGLLEKNIALTISLMEKTIFENYGHKVILTRNKDEYVPIEKRIQISNENKSDILISNHVNCGNARGVEVYHSFYDNKGKILAKNISSDLTKVGFIDRGPKSRKGIVGDYNMIIRESKAIAVMIELGFIDNCYDLELLKDEYILNKASENIVISILNTLGLEYLNVKEKSYNILLDGVVMLTVNDLELGKKYIINSVKDKICSEGQIIMSSSGEEMFSLK